jgi:hypothetical protein
MFIPEMNTRKKEKGKEKDLRGLILRRFRL